MADEKPFMQIDLNELEVEWCEQPKLFEKWAKRLADARLDVDEAKCNLEVTRAELDRDIRTDPGQFGLEKATEGSISTTILLQKVYQADLAKLNTAKHNVDVLQATVTALDHRKKALENLVHLHGQQYWSPPRARGGDDKEAMDTVRKKRIRNRQPEEDDE